MTISKKELRNFIVGWLELSPLFYDNEKIKEKFKILLKEIRLILKIEKEHTQKEIERQFNFMCLTEQDILKKVYSYENH